MGRNRQAEVRKVRQRSKNKVGRITTQKGWLITAWMAWYLCGWPLWLKGRYIYCSSDEGFGSWCAGRCEDQGKVGATKWRDGMFGNGKKERENKLCSVSEHRSLNRVNLKQQRLHHHQLVKYRPYSQEGLYEALKWVTASSQSQSSVL